MGLLLPPVGLLLHPPKSDDKYAQKSVQLVRGLSFRSDFLQNLYFKWPTMQDLAQATLDEVNQAWAGLGVNSVSFYVLIATML